MAYNGLVSPDVECVKGKIGNDTFGELLDDSLAGIAVRSNLGPESTFLDIGAGIGHACLSLGLRSGCHSVAFEKAEAASKLAIPLYRVTFRKCSRSGHRIGHHQFINADITDVESNFTTAVSSATCILCNNWAFQPQLMNWIVERLRIFAQPGTHLFVTEELVLAQTRQAQDPQILPQPSFDGPCSWSGHDIPIYHYIFQGIPSNVTAASLHRTALPGDEDWYPKYPPTERSCMIATPYCYYAVPKADSGIVHCRELWKDDKMREEELQTETEGQVANWVSKPGRRHRARVNYKRKRDWISD
ncbi:histone methylation protein DOT1-domain-containing protein [Mycena haematopus]|nr:histone methylation protein DOT1-domain-containing protein [Mycena haematopus]